MKLDKYLSATPEMTESELALLLSELGSCRKEGRILEIGTASGGTLIRMLQFLRSGIGRRIDIIDTFDYFPSHLDTLKNNLNNAGIDPALINIRVGYSKDEFKKSQDAGELFSFI